MHGRGKETSDGVARALTIALESIAMFDLLSILIDSTSELLLGEFAPAWSRGRGWALLATRCRWRGQTPGERCASRLEKGTSEDLLRNSTFSLVTVIAWKLEVRWMEQDLLDEDAPYRRVVKAPDASVGALQERLPCRQSPAWGAGIFNMVCMLAPQTHPRLTALLEFGLL